MKVNGKDIFCRLDVLYCLWQDISYINVEYKDGYYVLEISGGDGGYAHFSELWFDENRIVKTIIFANGEKTDTTTIITHKEVVYD